METARLAVVKSGFRNQKYIPIKKGMTGIYEICDFFSKYAGSAVNGYNSLTDYGGLSEGAKRRSRQIQRYRLKCRRAERIFEKQKAGYC